MTGDRTEAEAFQHFKRTGWEVIDHPYGATGPDLLIEHPEARPRLVEIRCKYPDHKNRYGLESPKDRLWLAADILYLIKDTKRRGWYAANLRELPPPEDGAPGSYYGGEFDPNIPNRYWSCEFWMRLEWEFDSVH